MLLFDYQIKAAENVISNLIQKKSVLLYSPTGSGKTVIASYVAEHFNTETLFLVNRQVLVSQSYKTLIDFNLKVSVFHNSIHKTPEGIVMNDDVDNSNVVISLVETLEKNEFNFIPKFIIIDEAHKSTSESYQILRDKYPDAMILGLSASPKREKNKEGEALCDWYDVMVSSKTVKELIKEKRLARPNYNIMSENDHVIDTWFKITSFEENKRTIVFTSDTRHSVAVKQAFIENGIAAEIITSGSDLDGVDYLNAQTSNQRNEIFNKFHNGEIDVLISVNALCEGFDEKLAKYCFILRKVGAVALFHQMVGRVLRWHDTKPEGYIVDFMGNVEEYGPIEEYVWEMDGSGHKESIVANNGDVVYYGHFNRKPKIFVICEDCSHVYDIAAENNCPCCIKKNVVKVSATFSQLKDFFVQKIDNDTWSKFCSNKYVKKGDEFWHFFDIIEKAFTKKMYHQFNAMYCEIFDVDGFAKEFSWMKFVLDKKRKIKYNDRIEFAL